MTVNKGRVGSDFDDFLKDEGLYEEVTAGAIKRILTQQISEAMKAGDISKSEMARRMHTSRSQLDRLARSSQHQAVTAGHAVQGGPRGPRRSVRLEIS